MLTDKELIAAQDADIKNLLNQISDLNNQLKDANELASSKSRGIHTNECHYNFRENYFYFGSGNRYCYRCHVLQYYYNSYSDEIVVAFRKTGIYYLGHGFKIEYGSRSFKSVYTWDEAIAKLDKAIARESKNINSSKYKDLVKMKQFIVDNKDISNNAEYDQSYINN